MSDSGESDSSDSKAWLKGMGLVVLVALIWIAASYLVQAVEDDGLPPFVLTYICNSLFIIYVPMVEFLWWRKRRSNIDLSCWRKASSSFVSRLLSGASDLRSWFEGKLSRNCQDDKVPLVRRRSSNKATGVSSIRGDGQFTYEIESPATGSLVEDPHGHGIVVKRCDSKGATQPPTQEPANPQGVCEGIPCTPTRATGADNEQRCSLEGTVTGGISEQSRAEVSSVQVSEISAHQHSSKMEAPEIVIPANGGNKEPLLSTLHDIESPDEVSRLPSFRSWIPSPPSRSKQCRVIGLASTSSICEAEEVDAVTLGVDESKDSSGHGTGEWTRARIAGVSLLICPFWFLAQLTFNVSLNYTTVSSNTILSSTASLFTLILSVVFLGETFTITKLLSVVLVILGTAVVSLADGRAPHHAPSPTSSMMDLGSADSLAGDLLCLCSAFFYAVYTTLLRKCAPEEHEADNDAKRLSEQSSAESDSRQLQQNHQLYCASYRDSTTSSSPSVPPSLFTIEESHGGLGEKQDLESKDLEAEPADLAHTGSTRLSKSRTSSEGSPTPRSSSGCTANDEPDSLPLVQREFQPSRSDEDTCVKLSQWQQQLSKVSGAEASERSNPLSQLMCCSYPVPYSTALMFGYLGFFNMLIMLPLLFLLPVQRHWPSSLQWGLVITKGLFDNVLSDYLWAIAVLLTTPTAATVGLQIQIPISMVVDSISLHALPDLMHLLGATLVLAGFLGINSLIDIEWMCRASTRPGNGR